jgi:peroxiredoxin
MFQSDSDRSRPVTTKFLSMKRFCLLLFVVFTTLRVSAQYDIQFHIKDYRKGYATLGYYFNGRTLAVDSILVDSATNIVHFKGVKPLKNGLYFMFVRQAGITDFIVNLPKDKACILAFTTHIKGIADSIRAENDAENKAYFEYSKILRLQRQQIEQNKTSLDMIRRATKDRSATADIEKRIQDIYKGLNDYTQLSIQKNPNTFFAKMLQTQQIGKVPERIQPRFGNGAINPDYLTYIRYHFWDNFDFQDERCLYSNVFVEKMAAYYRQATPPVADSINIAADKLIAKASIHPIYKKTAINWLTEQSDSNNDMIAPTVFTHLVEKYHAKDSTLTDLATFERLKYKAALYKPNLLGKKAPELTLKNENDQPISLASINSPYTMVYFFSPLCKHCQEKMPLIKEAIANFSAKGMKCYAIAVDKEVEYWKNFVREKPFEATFVTSAGDDAPQKSYAAYNLPVIFVLDKDKKIVGRHVAPEQLREFLGNLK